MRQATRTPKLLLAVVILAALLGVAWAGGAQTKKMGWEYKHLALGSSQESEFDKTLTQQGAEGWELVAVEREQPGGLVHFYFKRSK